MFLFNTEKAESTEIRRENKTIGKRLLMPPPCLVIISLCSSALSRNLCVEKEI
jgi:hypothetical protein